MKPHCALIAAATLMAACSGSNQTVATRQGPQAASPITWVGYQTAPSSGVAADPVVLAEPAQPVEDGGNEYNRNADIYRAGFEGALTTALP